MNRLKIALTASALITGLLATEAEARGRIEKVDGVVEGIDMKQVAVDANGAGYTSTATASHKFIICIYAKAKGRDGVYWAAVRPYAGSAVEVG